MKTYIKPEFFVRTVIINPIICTSPSDISSTLSEEEVTDNEIVLSKGGNSWDYNFYEDDEDDDF